MQLRDKRMMPLNFRTVPAAAPGLTQIIAEVLSASLALAAALTSSAALCTEADVNQPIPRMAAPL